MNDLYIIDDMKMDNNISNYINDKSDIKSEDIETLTKRIMYLENLIRKYKYCSLTGFMKEQDFQENFQRIFEEYKLENNPFTLSIIDINYLHNVNKQGWNAGNKLIQSVANQLKERFPMDKIFRIGGDEFCIITRDSYMSFDDIVDKLSTVTDVTTVSKSSNGFFSSQQLFKAADKELIELKLSRKGEQKRL